MPELGCYSVTFLVDGTHEQSVVMKVTDGDVSVPEANLPGWSPSSESLRAVLATVRTFDEARRRTDGAGAQLRDVPGGWDVSVGNVVLADTGHPACVAHGELELAQAATYACPTCGAQALYGNQAQ